MQHDTNVITMILRYLMSGLLGIWILGTTAVLGFYSPQHVMVDVTNDFGVCVLQLLSSKKENIAFSPYGLVSVALVLYEGSTGPSAAEIHNSLRLPWDREVTRVGFRDMHRYLKSYFSNDGFLRGLVLSKPNIGLRKNYTDLLQFYGFDVRTSQPHIPQSPRPPTLTTLRPVTTSPTPTTIKPPKPTIVPERTTTTPPPDTTLSTFSSRFGSTTPEPPKRQTTLLTTLNDLGTTLSPQTNLPSSRTTLERSTATTSVPTITTLVTTQSVPPTTTTIKPQVTTQTTTTTQIQTTTKPPTTTTPTPTTTKAPETTSTTPKPTTTPIPPTPSPTTTTATPTTKVVDTTQAGTTLDVVTMTDKKPNTLEIMSQVNMSALTTTAEPKPDMQDREGDMDMMDLTQKPPETTTVSSTTMVDTTIKPQETTKQTYKEEATTVMMEPEMSKGVTTNEPSSTTMSQSKETTTLGTIDSVEVSVAATTVVKSVSIVDPNTTPTPFPVTGQTAVPEEDSTTPLEQGGVTLVIETTTAPSVTSMSEDSTEMASESMMDQATTTQEGEATTLQEPEPTSIPQPESTAKPQPEATVAQQADGTTKPPETTTIRQPEATTIQQPEATTIQQPEATTIQQPDVTITQQPDGTTKPPEATTIQLSEATTKPPNDDESNATTVEETIKTTQSTTYSPSTQVVLQTGDTSILATTTTPQPTTTEAASPTTLKSQETTAPSQETTAPSQETTTPSQETTTPQTTTATPTLTTLEMIDSAASENRLVAALARQQRSLYSTRKTPEQQQSGSNWVPHYYDQQWGRNPSNEFWFFTYTGGENVQAHTYTAYLPFAFIPELSSLALQLPLDDPRYSILILLPEERLGLSQLLYSLQWCPVRAITTNLKMTAVYAVVPAFTIVKHVNLVPALAKLGIHSVFDPFRADLSPMTSEPHLFVRTIEQVVTVSLRKYYASNRWFEASPSEVQQHFVANHPFVYFVLDKETDVTLMAGTIVNPVAHNQE